PLARLARVVVRRLPERVGGDLAGVAVLGDDVDDRYAARAQVGEERRRPLDHGAAALGGQRQRGHGRVEVAAVHVDGDHGGARGIEVDDGANRSRAIAEGQAAAGRPGSSTSTLLVWIAILRVSTPPMVTQRSSVSAVVAGV